MAQILTQACYSIAHRINVSRLEAALRCHPSQILASPHWHSMSRISMMSRLYPSLVARSHLHAVLSYRLINFQGRCISRNPLKHVTSIISRRLPHDAEIQPAPSVCVATLEGHCGPVNCVAFHPSLPYFATGGNDGAVRLWRLDCILIEATCVSIHHHEVRAGCSCPMSCAAFHPTAPYLVTGSHDYTTRLWWLSPDFTAAKCVLTLREHSAVISVAFHPAAPYLATGHRDSGAQLWKLSPDFREATCVSRLRDRSNHESCLVSFFPAAPFVLTAGSSETLWRLENLDRADVTAAAACRLQNPNHSASCVTFHPFAPVVVIGGEFGWVPSGSERIGAKLWRLLKNASPSFFSAEEVLCIRGYFGIVTSVAFHPSAPYLATGHRDSGAQLWKLSPDFREATCVAKFYHGSVCSVAFHPSGRCLVTGSEDCTTKIWR
jgi:WD40 repeat protein